MLTPKKAYLKAKRSGGTPELRTFACGDPESAFFYALNVDIKCDVETRTSACGDPEYAYQYAFSIDKCSPRDDTRKGACTDPKYAYLYAIRVDKHSTDETWSSVFNSVYQGGYERELCIPEEQIRIKKLIKVLRSKEYKKGLFIC